MSPAQVFYVSKKKASFTVYVIDKTIVLRVTEGSSRSICFSETISSSVVVVRMHARKQ